jgi:hypothetical protein
MAVGSHARDGTSSRGTDGGHFAGRIRVPNCRWIGPCNDAGCATNRCAAPALARRSRLQFKDELTRRFRLVKLGAASHPSQCLGRLAKAAQEGAAHTADVAEAGNLGNACKEEAANRNRRPSHL